MKRQFNVTIEVRKMLVVPVEATDEVEAEQLAGYEIEDSWDIEEPHYAEWFVYDVREVD
jgi:hypothetical protein